MKSQKLKIPAQAETQVHGAIKTLVIKRATNSFDIETSRAERYSASQGDKITFERIADTIRFFNPTDEIIELTIVIIRSGEGDLVSTAGTVEIVNPILSQAVPVRRIKNYKISDKQKTRILKRTDTRSRALIQTTGPVWLYDTPDSTDAFLLDGDMDDHSTDCLYASAQAGQVTIRVMEYLL